MVLRKMNSLEPIEEPGFRQIMMAVKRPAVLFNVPIHLFILIPLTCLIAYLGIRADRVLGWQRITHEPWNIVAFVIFFCAGIFVVWYTYGYLAIMGDGSPATHLGGTRRLVTTGPFALCRHPSIIGKFLGVLGLGLLVGSPTFLFIIIPLLTTYSLFTARFMQERRCVELWQEAYLEYRREVPLVLPLGRRRGKSSGATASGLRS